MKFAFHNSCPPAFVKEARAHIMHPRGWSRRHHLEEVGNEKEAQVVIRLLPPKAMDSLYGGHAHLRNLSVTDSRNDPIRIDIHQGNWDAPPAAFRGSKKIYRAYVINHEIGHALGFGHAGLGRGKCNIMAQQTKGTEGCTPNGYPF